MADKIDQIKINNASGTAVSYDIDLPKDATPSITGIAAASVAAAHIYAPNGNANIALLTNGNTLNQANAYTLVSGQNCTVAEDGTISAVNNDTWRAATSSTNSDGYLYGYSQTAGQNGWNDFRFNGSGTDHLRTATGVVTSITAPKNSTYTSTVTFAATFNSTPVVSLCFGHASNYSVHVQLRSVTAGGFQYTIARPSGAAAIGNCSLYWFAVDIY